MTGVTERVSVDSVGNRGNGGYYPAISATGRFIAFLSSSRPRIPGGDIGQSDVFVYDRKTGTIEWVSVDSAGNQSNGTNLSVAISATGRFVAFGSLADNLVPGDTNGVLNVFAGADVFVRDLAGK